jgi:hypothetical protein
MIKGMLLLLIVVVMALVGRTAGRQALPDTVPTGSAARGQALFY